MHFLPLPIYCYFTNLHLGGVLVLRQISMTWSQIALAGNSMTHWTNLSTFLVHNYDFNDN
jgi:hypothetical protein